MTVFVTHDSHLGNGRKLAEDLKTQFESNGAEVTVAHHRKGDPAWVAENPPEILVADTAVRKFFTSLPTRRWISRLSAELEKGCAKIPFAAIFLTHALPDSMLEGRASRLRKAIEGVSGIGQVHVNWLSGP